MDSDERLRWLEIRITSSLRPRADDLRNLFGRDESRGSLLEFFFNNDARRLFVYITNDDEAVGDALKVSLSPPVEIKEKCLCFLKTGSASQIHSGNLDDSITCMDWAEPLSHSDMLLREVYLPLLCTDTDMVAKRGQDSTPLTNDKLMDVLHRLLANIEVTRGLSQGKVCLPLPSIEVLAEAAAFQHRQPAVVHVLESTVISWIKQIRGVLRHDALASARTLSKEAKESIRPHHEVIMWEEHIEHMTSILEQLEAPVAMDILMNLTHANSAYAKSFGTVRAEVESALTNARARLRCFTTVLPWIQDMYRTSSLERMLKVFPPLLHTVLLIWKHSDYYHNVSVFAHLLQMLSNEVVARARSLVGDNPFEDTQRSYVALKDALRLCAAFRGTYLDVKEAANEINTKKLESNVVTMARLRPKDHNLLFQAKMYGPTGFQQLPGDPQVDGTEDHWEDSAWPARNVACFRGLSRFVERCNDLLDLVETTRHFYTLERAAKIGGAGSRSLDALVQNIHQVFVKTIREFTKKNQDVLTIDDKQHFEKAFFHYRSVVKTLERRLAGVLRRSLTTCQTPMAHLRVLEVFEGISARELLQKELSTENDLLVSDLIAEFKSVKSMFAESTQDVPKHANMPPTVSKFYWVRALKQRIGIPMRKLRAICPHVLESDKGWLLRDAFTDVMNELERYESKLQVSWMHSVDHDIRDRLKNFVLAPEEILLEETGEHQPNKDIHNGNEISETTGESPRERLTTLKVNLDQRLLVMMRDIKYIQRSPYEVPIPASVRALLRTVDASTLNTQATRLRTVVSKYNHIVKKMKEYELLLFENKMRRVDELVLEGRESITWMSSDLEDYLEKANAVISEDVYRCLTRVHNNWAKVEGLARSWSEGELGIFTSEVTRSQTHSLKELLDLHDGMDLQYKNKLIPAGVTIHKLLQDSFEAIEISAASPAWQLYTAQMDAVVLIALKNSILTSLDAMYAITTATTDDRLPAPPLEPILTVRLELVEQTVSFTPPMDRSASVDNIEDAIGNWLATYLKRANLVNRLTDPSSTYSDFINDDSDVWEVVEEIQNAVGENMAECKQLLSLFDNYRFLWVQDVQQSFYDFLSGRPSPNPLRASKQSQMMKTASQITGGTSQRSRFSMNSPDAVTEAERAFLTPHHTAGRSRATSLGHGGHPTALASSSEGGMEANIPGLAEFDEEIGIYKAARDNIQSLADFRVVGWLNINFQPIKQVLITYASKWMWTFTKYLCDQVTDSLNTLAGFLARTEPEIESITGEERDTASFMKMMRLFNDVSAQQQEMEEKFAIMHRTVLLLEKYGMKLSSGTQQMFKSAPDRWNHLKTKVSLAKQRLGPRIQEESARITRDLLRFGDRVEALASELHSSAVFSKECPIHSAIESINVFSKHLRLLQKEAQDLIELQELLETAVVNFSVLPQHQKDLKNLKVTWEHKRLCEAEQREWKLKHWQKIDAKQLQQATRRQKELIESLPNDVMEWDVYQGMIDSVIVIEQCLPLVENLNNPAMRTRHWKQLVRVTGGLLQTDTDSLRKMVLGDLLELGLQKHAEEVKSIVQRAVKDLTIETSLKTCEEVWLGKVFEVQPHTRGLSRAPSADIEAGSEITGSEMMPHAVLQTYEGSRTTGGTKTKSLKSGPHSRSSDKTGPGSISRGRGGGRTSVLSLPISLVNLIDDPSPICLLKNVDKIFAELEHHQIELTRMQSNSAIGAFMDEVTKWQKKLQLLEAVLRVWVSVQEKWVQLDEIYSGADVRTALAHEANMFAVMSKDFRLLMRATEKNINVLQSCSRKGLLPMLEKMDAKMEQCRHALLGNLERRRQRFPRFYFLSPEDVMNIVCYGYDLNAVNKYLCKVLPNLGKLIYDEKDGLVAVDPNKLNPPAGHGSSARRPKKYFLVKGLSSTTGEEMILSKSLSYEGPMSQWLPQLIEGIKITLQEQLHVALGFAVRPANVERDLRSAGASKVRVSRPSSATSQRSGGSVEASSVSDGVKALASIKERPSDLAVQVSKSLGVSVPLSEVAWTLDNNTQVALLATSIKHNMDLFEAVKTRESILESLKSLRDKTQTSLDSTVIMLKGMEDERTSRLKSATYKSAKGKEKAADGTAGKIEGTAYSESFGAPSSTRSLLEDDIDVGGDEASVNDAMEGTGPAPINTMQSLLFTEQMQSGGQGIRQDTMEMELSDVLPRVTAEIAPTATDSKLFRYPAQIHKIASLITILAQQRDSCHSLLDKANHTDLEKSFDFQARLHHLYNEETMQVSLQLLNWEFDYGYEYQGSSARYIVSPSCDSAIVSMCQALHSQRGVLLSRPKNRVSGMSRMQTLSELAGQMGRALYSVVCSSSVDRYMLGDLFKGLAETGCWLCLEGIGNLTAGILSVACQLAGDVLQALRMGQHTLTLQGEEVNLVNSGGFFSTLDYSLKHQKPVKMFCPHPDLAAHLPVDFLKHFRVVNAVSPDSRTVLEIRLLAHGFTQAVEMSQKLCTLLKLAEDFFSCSPQSPGEVNLANGKTNVVSLHILEKVIGSAGVAMDALLHKQMEKKQEYREVVANKVRKFAELWRHKSSVSGSVAIDSGGETDVGLTSSSSATKPPQDLVPQPQRSDLEEDVEAMRKMEEEAIVIAIKNLVLPRMPHAGDRRILVTLIQDLWPDVADDFAMEDAEEIQKPGKVEDSWLPDISTEVSTPVRQTDTDSVQFHRKHSTGGHAEGTEATIASAMAMKNLCPSSAFQSRVSQMVELVDSMKAIITTGKPGCGKTTVLEVYAEVQKQMGVDVTCKTVYLNSFSSSQPLFGYYEGETREWRDGLIQRLLRPYCFGKGAKPEDISATPQQMLILHLDGVVHTADTDMFMQLLQDSASIGSGGQSNPGTIILPNNERLRRPAFLRIVWELESLSHLTPTSAVEFGVLAFRNTEITWRVHLAHWVGQLPEMIQELLRDLFDLYLPKIVELFTKGTKPPHVTISQGGKQPVTLRQVVKVSIESMTLTFCRLLGCLTGSSFLSISEDECERYVGYAAFWAFGGTLDMESRNVFTTWWNEQWPSFFPKDYDPWHVFVDSDTRAFTSWANLIPQFTGLVRGGQASSRTAGGSSQDEEQRQLQQDKTFVHTQETMQLNHIMGLLNEAGHPVMIAGPAGCGKTALVQERVNAVSSGEVAEILSLSIHCNRLTEAGGLWKRISNYLEWKHGSTYVPRGNKKLLCVVDDLNLSKPITFMTDDKPVLQSACEIIRQHLDTGGIRNVTDFKWQQVSNVSYVTTVNPTPSCTSFPLSQRLSRHFAVFTWPYPSEAMQKSIFSTMLSSHFLHTLGTSALSGIGAATLWHDRPMLHLLNNVAMVTIELQERLRKMYLPIPQRAHYLFTLNDLDRIFRNLILSLRRDCGHNELLLLWRHECDWTYGRRMVLDVDLQRYHQALDTATRKYLTGNKHLPSLLSLKQPLFSSVRELDSGLVTAGRYEGRISQSALRNVKTETSQDVRDYYKAVSEDGEAQVHKLLSEAVKEYNKVNVGMNLSLYRDTVKLVCRLARILQSPHKTGHTLLFGEGCPMLARLSVNLAAHLGGFHVKTLRPSLASPEESVANSDEARLAHFKEFMANLYNLTGVKGQKIVLFLSDDRVLTHECIAVAEELVRHGAISHMFSGEEQTTIANSVRSEVTAAGLTYSKDVAWNFFQSTVMKNLRIVFASSDMGKNFMATSHEFSALFNHLNIITMLPWSREQLVEVTLYHIQSEGQGKEQCILAEDGDRFPELKRKNRRPMNDQWMENVAHLLANMHVSVRQKSENKFYKMPGHVSNYGFEKLVLRFVDVFHARRLKIRQTQHASATALSNLDKENAIVENLQKDLAREKQILEEHKIGTTQLLSQIGQDMVITQQQKSAVQQQIRRIHHLKKSLPEYQHAHERSVFKASAIVADTKKLVKDIDVQSLTELRALQKPDNDVEDLMACIIMILKSPNSDLTWSKGAKRQMANIDRFIDELINFDNGPLPQTTLDALDPTLEKETFTAQSLQAKAGGNLAVGTLVQWVQAVVRYHTLMISKVKPLHGKLEETSTAIAGAEHKLRQLESKMHALEARLLDLGEGFEQATADKNQQEKKQSEMKEHLKKAAEFQTVIAEEHRRRTAVLDACDDQLEWITGVAAVAAGFATYMGPYPYMFRRMLLTVDWAQCFVERGIPLVFDSIDPVRGHRIEFMLDVQDGTADMTPRMEDGDTGREEQEEQEEEAEGGSEESTNQQSIEQKDEDSIHQSSSEELAATDSNTATNLPPLAEETDADDEGNDTTSDASKKKVKSRQSEEIQDDGVATFTESTTMAIPAYTYATLPFMSTEEYQMFVGSIVKVLVGEELMQEWLMKDFSHHQLQNAVILHTSWQRPPLLLDPYLAGVDWYASVFCQDKKIVPVNLSSKTDNTQVIVMEKAIMAGHTLMLMDCEQQPGNFLRPLVYHANMTRLSDKIFREGTRSVRWLGRRLICPDSFRLCMSTAQPAHNIHPNIIAASQLISYVPSTETLQEDLLNRALSRVRPEIFRERKRVMHALRQHRRTLAQLDAVLNDRLVTEVKPRQIENSTKFILSIVELKAQVFEELRVVENLFTTLNELTEELFPIARRAALLYTICRALPALNPHYQIPLPFFLHLFDTTIGTDQEEDDDEFVLGDVKVVKPFSDEVDDQAYKEASDGFQISPSDLRQRRKSKLRLGSASRLLKRGIQDEKESDAAGTNDSGEKQSDNGKQEGEEPVSEEQLGKKAQFEITIPTTGHFPTEDVKYTNFPADEVSKIVSSVTERVFEHIYHSVNPEHQLHVSALTLLNIELDASLRQEEEKEGAEDEEVQNSEPREKDKPVIFSEEELTLLIHGNPGFGGGVSLSLEDFDCQAPVPNWMSADHWEDLLAFSVLPGPLEGICVQVAQCADHWREWYECPEPELAPFPTKMNAASGEKSEDVSELSDFHRLLLVRTMRPDRLLPALQGYVQNHVLTTDLEKTFVSSEGPNCEVLFKDVSNTLGVLVALPDVSDPNVHATLPMSPIGAIKMLAERFKMNVTVVSVGDGCQQDVAHAVEQAHAEDSWLVVDGLHFAASKFYEDLQLHLARIGNISRQSDALGETDKEDDGGVGKPTASMKAPKFLVWLTTLPSPSLPPTLTQYLYKLSWKSLVRVASQSAEPGKNVLPDTTAPVFKDTLLCNLQSVTDEIMAKLSEAPYKSLYYSSCVCHAVALTGQCFGWHGLTRRYALTDAVLHLALSHIVSDVEAPHAVNLIKKLYSDVVTAEQDKEFVMKLFDDVLTYSMKHPDSSKLRVNSTDIRVPPSTISPAEYAAWAMKEIPDDIDSTSLVAVHPSAHQWKITQTSEAMLDELQNLFDAAQDTAYETSVAVSNASELTHSKVPISLASVQTSIEMCLEQLPNLLELGGYQLDTFSDFDFPYHRPSVLSINNSPSALPLPESIGYVLMQECLWFNRLLCLVRQQLHMLRRSLLLTSDYKLSKTLVQAAQALIAEDVPSMWLHPNDLPSTHTLLTWLADMNMRYTQFRSWIKEGVVPMGSKSPVGKLTSVWLGGLVNPKALLTAICHEKAVTHDVLIDKVTLKSKILPEMESQTSALDDHEPSICLKSVHSLNMKWKPENGFLVPLSSKDKEINEVPIIYLYPVIEEEEEASSSGKEPLLHDFPVYMNVSRHTLVFHLPLPVETISSQSTDLLPGMQHASIVLQAGLDAARRNLCKTRAHLARKRREEWEKVTPEISDLMSRSATRLSSGQMSVSGPPASYMKGGDRGSISSRRTSQLLTVPPGHKKKRSSIGSGQGLDAGSKAKSSSQHSLSSHASTLLSHKPPSRVPEEREEEDASDGQNGRREEENDKPLPNGRIVHKHPSEVSHEGDQHSPPDGAGDPPGASDAVARGVIAQDFFAIKEAPSTEASLLQSILDEDQPDDDETDDNEGSERFQPSTVSASDVGAQE